MLTSLESQVYQAGEIIMNRGEPVRHLIFIKRGMCSLNGFFTDSKGVEHCTPIVNLHK